MEKGGLTGALQAVGLTRASRIGFADELRLGLRGTTRRVWGRRGTKVRQRLQMTYEWRYLFAAVDGQAGRVWWNWVPSMKAEALWPTIAGIQEDDLLDGLVWDNAPSHRDDEITDPGLQNPRDLSFLSVRLLLPHAAIYAVDTHPISLVPGIPTHRQLPAYIY